MGRWTVDMCSHVRANTQGPSAGWRSALCVLCNLQPELQTGDKNKMLLRQVPELKIVSGFFNLTSLKCTTAQSRHDHNCNDPTGGVAQQQLGSSALQLGCVLFL